MADTLIERCYYLNSGEFDDTRAFRMGGVKVLHEYVWFILENGYAVGFNENPSRGYSFPVVKYKQK